MYELHELSLDEQRGLWLAREAGIRDGYSRPETPSKWSGMGLYTQGRKEGSEMRRVADEVKRLTTPVEIPRMDIPLVKPHLPLEDRTLRTYRGY
jgi:hypothetical protein